MRIATFSLSFIWIFRKVAVYLQRNYQHIKYLSYGIIDIHTRFLGYHSLDTDAISGEEQDASLLDYLFALLHLSYPDYRVSAI